MRTDANGSGNGDIKALEQQLVRHLPGNTPLSTLKDLVKETALVSLKPFRLNRSWIKVPKKNSEIGVGGYGVVHRAILQKWMFAPKAHVAVKKFHTFGDREKLLPITLGLVKELEVWAKLDHPNVLPLVGFHLSPRLDEAWLVSPYATNGNVFEYLERTNLGLDERLELLNVLIDTSGHAMLCDLGLAKATDASGGGEAPTTNNNGGTVRYWAPELFENNCPTLKTDVWAWGCLLLEIITGEAPYHQILLEGRLIHEISNNKSLPADLEELKCPPHIRDLLSRCWEIDPELRPTMTESLTLLTGGFGVVYQAVMKTNWRHRGVVVAVKKLRAMGNMDKRLRMATALVRELAVWARLSHPNIIPLIGYHLNPRLDEAWLVSSYMDLGNLSQYLISTQPSLERRLRLLNVLINTQRRAVLCDFGLAKTMENLPSGLTTSTFNQAGSLAYESPELLLGKSLRALESDVWAWGCLLQEIFSGKGPYHWANNPGAIVKWIIQDIPPATVAEIDCTRNISEGSESAASVLEALEAKSVRTTARVPRDGVKTGFSQGIFSIEGLEVKRSNIHFTEDSKMGTGYLGALYQARLSADASTPGDVVALRRLLPSGEAMQIRE
ncbi:hypothetical protein FRB99_001576, partial [Tulasnella sp. 403]